MAGATNAHLRKLEEARALLASDSDPTNVEAVLRLLLDVWKKVPSTRLGALIEKLSARLPREDLPKKVAEREARWLAIAASADFRVVPTLLSVDWPVHPRGVKARIEHLVKFDPDPRIANALRELWLGGQYRSNAGFVFWRRAFRLLLNWKDPQIADVLEKARRTGDAEYRAFTSVLARRTATPLPEEPELSPEIASTLEALEALAGIDAKAVAAGRVSREQLFADVYADPSNDAPRLVLADFLLQDDDPRGELIQLMHAMESGRRTAKGEARIHALLRTSERKWLDGLEHMVTEPRSFRCGFLSEATVENRIDPTPPAWSTVELLHVRGREAEESIDAALAHPHFRSVTRIDGLSASRLPALGNLGRAFPYVGVHAPLGRGFVSGLQIKHLAVFRDTARAQMLRTPEVLAWFAASPSLRESTELLEIDAFEDGLVDALNALSTYPVLREVRLRPYFHSTAPIAWELCVARGETGEVVLDAAWHGKTYGEIEPERLGTVLMNLPAHTFERISLRFVTRMSVPRQSQLEEHLRHAIKSRHPKTPVELSR